MVLIERARKRDVAKNEGHHDRVGDKFWRKFRVVCWDM